MSIPELLAPAGSPASALAALDAGADAIYCGLSKFNARERGENFSQEQMGSIIDLFHKNGKKVYITFNTLVKESELSEVTETLAALSELGPDALIVQDLGVLRLIREYFPRLRIHGSTQMGIHNRPGLELAHEMGIKRVILERQCTFDELKHLAAKSPVELEMFVHGALCCSLSGQCLFSSIQGGHSGNRGRCKQPCRRRFYNKDGNGFFFSPQDLCLIDHIKEIKDLNIASLKIEGRLRQPDYVYNVVSAYRSLLDSDNPSDKTKLGEARNQLSKTCGRKWSDGFATPSAFRTLIAHSSLGASGLLCGTVKRLDEHGFAFECTKKLHVGDRLRIQPQRGDDGPALTVTKMFVSGASVLKAKPGEDVFVCCDKEVPFQGLIYKIGESFKDYSAQLAALPLSKTPLKLKVKLNSSACQVFIVNSPLPTWSQAVNFAPAKQHSLTPETVTAEFSMPDSPLFRISDVAVELQDGLFVPAGELKKLRRDFFDYLKANLNLKTIQKESAEGLARFALDYLRFSPSTISGRTVETVLVRPGGAMPAKREARLASSIFDFNQNTQEAVLPEFTTDNRLDSLSKAITRAYESGIRRFRIRSLFEFKLFAHLPGDVTLIASAPLGTCNSMAAKELQSLGCSIIQAQIELEKVAIENLRDHSPLSVEVYRFGRPVLLVTRAEIPASGDIKDARGNHFMVKPDSKSQLTQVYAGSIMSIPHVTGTLDFYDLMQADWKNPDTTEFNFSTELL